MEEIKKNIRRVFVLYLLLFVALGANLLKFLLVDSKQEVSSPYNPRLSMLSSDVVRGSIIDSSGNALAYTDSNGVRRYPFGSAAAHLVGYSDTDLAGAFGVEAAYNFQLESAHNELLQRFYKLTGGDDLRGNDAVLTLNSALQQYIYNQLDGYRAAAIVMEPSTGKILAMVSCPSFSPGDIHDNWNSLSADTESPLLNRAAQGEYPPGSVFKIVTTAAAIENLPDYASIDYICNGSDELGGKVIHCFDSTAHGEETIDKAFAVSCNTFFSMLGLRIGASNLRSTAEKLYFNKSLPYPLEYSVSSFALTAGSPDTELVDTSIGQGKTMVTPLLMALITSAVANGGMMMAPYVVDHFNTYNGKSIDKNLPNLMREVFTTEEADTIKQYMIGVAENGTAKSMKLDNVSIAAKTGSAQTPNGADHGWVVAFAPTDKPRFVLSLLVENSGGSASILPIAKNIISYLTN